MPKMLRHALLAVQYATDDEIALVYQQQEMLDMVEKEIPNDISLEQYIINGLIFEHAFEQMQAGKYEQAIELFAQVLATDKALSPVLGNLGICYLMLSKFEQSRHHLNQALAVDPSYALAKQTLQQLDDIEQGNQALPKEIRAVYHGQIERHT